MNLPLRCSWHKHQSSSGFTAVELIVVVIVIAVLSIVTIVAYGGVTDKAKSASLQSDLSDAATALKAFQLHNDKYPTTVSTDCSASPDSDTNKCIKLTNGNTIISYSSNAYSSPQTFLLLVGNGVLNYKVTNSISPTQLAQTMQPGVTPGAAVELHGAKANGGTGPGINSPLTTNWVDTSGNNKNGTLTNFSGSPWQGTGTAASPYRVAFDGVDDHIDTAALDLVGGGYTLEIWGIRSGAGTAWNVLASHFGPGLGETTYWLDNGDLITGLYTSTNVQWAAVIPQRHVFDLGVLTHYVITVNNNTLRAYDYVNKVASAPVVMSEGLGMPNGLGFNISYQACPITIASMRIYPFALTAAQVTANFDAGADW